MCTNARQSSTRPHTPLTNAPAKNISSASPFRAACILVHAICFRHLSHFNRFKRSTSKLSTIPSGDFNIPAKILSLSLFLGVLQSQTGQVSPPYSHPHVSHFILPPPKKFNDFVIIPIPRP